jgi:WD40 repeat protein
MALASDDGTVKIYDLVKSKALASYKIAKGYPYSMDINMNNNTLIAGDTDGFASIFHASCKDFVNRFLVHSSTVTSIHYNHSFDEITTSSYDGTCRQWIPVHRPLCLRTIIPNPKVLTPL